MVYHRPLATMDMAGNRVSITVVVVQITSIQAKQALVWMKLERALVVA
jgi:hypothetical protein